MIQTRNDDGPTEQSQWDRMVAGKLYNAFDHELLERRATARRLCRKLNSEDIAGPSHEATVRELLGIVGANPYIEPPFRCDYGMNITVGDNFYANYDCIILDACPVTIGDNVLFAPRVILTTATHPTDADARRAGQELGKPIAIGDNVWICAGAIINPGVTIGDNAIVASGAVVTADIPANCIAGGVPAKVLRRL